jgi:hypothetical protein
LHFEVSALSPSTFLRLVVALSLATALAAWIQTVRARNLPSVEVIGRG